jgi:2-dehydropantoate 2-reductase
MTEGKTVPPRVAVMGAGAVGCYFGGMLARAGLPVTFIGRGAQLEALARAGLLLDTLRFRERVAVSASASPAAVRDAEIVLFCVKATDTAEAARAIAPHLPSGAAVVSLQNGVDNVERLREAAEIEALPAVVYVAAALTAPGVVKHSGRGDLVVGVLPEQRARRELAEAAARIAQMFESAGVPCRLSENIEGDLWAKLVMNCAGNAVTALARTSYARAARHTLARELIRATAEEAIAVARAAGVALPAPDLVAGALQLAETLGEATSSTAQDIARGRRTEIDSLNGYVARRGAALGVPTPYNQALHALVRLLEEATAEVQKPPAAGA